MSGHLVIFLVACILILTSSISFFDLIQEAEGIPAVGPKDSKSYGSKNAGLVCGDRLCSEEEVPNDSQRFLEIKGDPIYNGTTTYQVVVSGQISLGPSANLHDKLSPDGTTIDGMVAPTGHDNYYFTGDIVSITTDQHVLAFIDGEDITAQVVPEFGTIAVMILGISIISIIAVTARSKVIPRL